MLNELEEKVYALVSINHKLGRIETDGSTTQIKYNKLSDERDKIRTEVAMLFKSLKNYYPNQLGWGKGKDE
jgi:hypothetical protein